MKNYDTSGTYTWSMSPYEVDKLRADGFSNKEIKDIDREYASWQQAIINKWQQRVNNIADDEKQSITVNNQAEKAENITVDSLNNKFIELTNKLIDQQLTSLPVDNTRLEIIAKNMQIINSMKSNTYDACGHDGCTHHHHDDASCTNTTGLYFR